MVLFFVFLFFGRHSVGASGFRLVSMREASNPYVKADTSMDNFETKPVLSGDPTPTNNQWQGIDRTVNDDVGSS